MKQRIFVATPAPPEIRSYLATVQEQLKSAYTNVKTRWVHPGNFHCTLAFIGEVSEATVERVRLILRNYEQHFQMASVSISHLDCFPDCNAPRVITVHLHENGKNLVHFQHQLQQALEEKGIIETDKSWIPHVTLARPNGEEPFLGHSSLEIEQRSWNVTRFALYKSTLTPKGSVYTPLEIFTAHVS